MSPFRRRRPSADGLVSLDERSAPNALGVSRCNIIMTPETLRFFFASCRRETLATFTKRALFVVER